MFLQLNVSSAEYLEMDLKSFVLFSGCSGIFCLLSKHKHAPLRELMGQFLLIAVRRLFFTRSCAHVCFAFPRALLTFNLMKAAFVVIMLLYVEFCVCVRVRAYASSGLKKNDCMCFTFLFPRSYEGFLTIYFIVSFFRVFVVKVCIVCFVMRVLFV